MNDHDRDELEKIADELRSIQMRLPVMETAVGTIVLVNIQGWLEQLEEKIRAL